MEAIKIISLKHLSKNWLFWLVLISGLAIVIRAIPGWLNAAWGCDFGIYFGLTKSVAIQGELFPDYVGWGSSYNYFPVLYAINTFAHWITGLDILVIMPKLTPIFGGLAVLVFYFVCYELLEDRKMALLSTLVLSVLPFHVYQLSHASPLTMGHFFMILSLYLFIKFRKNNIYAIPLALSTVLLVMSHHLTTYFYLVSLIFILFFENASRDKWLDTIKKDISYVFLASIFVFSYWSLIATPVYEGFMKRGLSFGSITIGSEFLIVLFYALFFSSFIIAKSIRKFKYFIEEKKKNNKSKFLKPILWFLWKANPFIKKPEPSIKSRVCLFSAILATCIITLTIFTYIPLPWTGFALTSNAVILTIPLLLAFSFGVTGFRYTCHIKNGFFIRGWLIAILFSFVYSMVTGNTTLYPHRHFEYLMYPVAILTVFGIGGIFSDPHYKASLSKILEKIDTFVNYRKRKIAFSQKKRVAFLLFFIVFISSLGLSAYSSHEALGQSTERITTEDINVVEWITGNVSSNTSIITSDHRLERLMEANGFNTSDDQVVYLWEAENISEYIEELIGIGRSKTKITHIIVDDIMKNNEVHIGPSDGVFRTKYMTNETWTGGYDKFKDKAFTLLYRNESININPETLEPVSWAEVYEVNWTYIENEFFS